MGGFFALTWHRPFELVFDTGRRGESPIGFHRFHIVSYELTDYEGAGVQTSAPMGGLPDLLAFLVGLHDPCAA